MTEGEISEAMHMAALKQFPLLMFVQDNGWDISANREEVHHSNAVEYAKGFTGIETRDLNGSNFIVLYNNTHDFISIRSRKNAYSIAVSLKASNLPEAPP